MLVLMLLAGNARWVRADQPAVASINLCADQLLILLAEPEQILAVSNLAREAAGSHFVERARHLPVTDGNAEQILAMQPDLVIAGAYTTRYSVNLLRSLGTRVEILPIANSIEDMFSNLQRVAGWLGQQQKAAVMIKQLRSRLESVRSRQTQIANSRQGEQRSLAVVYDANGFTVGPATLRGEMLELAGWENVARQEGIETYGNLTLETLVKLSPHAIVESPYQGDSYSRAQRYAQHPVLRSSGIDPMIIRLDSSDTVCAGPWSIDLVEQLQQARMELVQQRDQSLTGVAE